MLLNLALNAQQAMPEGGMMELQTQLDDGRVQLAMIDNGVGMDEATQAKLFRRLFFDKDRRQRPRACRRSVKLSRPIRGALPARASRDGEPGL